MGEKGNLNGKGGQFYCEEEGREMCVECWEIASSHSGFYGQVLELVNA